jgi:AraC-like DNA-binding protein
VTCHRMLFVHLTRARAGAGNDGQVTLVPSIGPPLTPPRFQWRRSPGGKSVVDAAYAAGFSDAAHFTRTFRRMIGAPPRQVLQRRFAARDFRLKG